MSPCPRCKTRARRKPGALCTPCEVERNRSARRNKRREQPAPFEMPKFGVGRVFKKKKFLITSAQNATPVHAKFFETLKVAAEHLNAELVVIPLRYKNPTSRFTPRDESQDWWSKDTQPYLYNARQNLGPNLVLVGDVKIQPTAASPLTGFESLTGAESCIIGHTKMQFRSVSAPTGRYPKILTTTGACTERNYSDTKAGALGQFHHYLGALIVELDGEIFHLRQLNADRGTGEFIDLDKLYTARGVRKAPPALGLQFGDVHARFADPVVDRATHGRAGIVDTLNPETLVWEDVLDGYSINPHHAGDPFVAAAKFKSKFGGPQAEVEHAVEFIRARTGKRKSVVVASNHDDFLSRWIRSTDWRSDPANAAFYLETATAMHKSARLTPNGAEYADPFAYWVDRLKGDSQIRCLGSDESFRLADIECSLHGHRGPNGARGSLENLSRLGAKVNSGHSHSPGIKDGHYQAGTSTPLRLEYNHGPSSWQNTHIVTYANGARALITLIAGHWRAKT